MVEGENQDTRNLNFAIKNLTQKLSEVRQYQSRGMVRPEGGWSSSPTAGMMPLAPQVAEPPGGWQNTNSGLITPESAYQQRAQESQTQGEQQALKPQLSKWQITQRTLGYHNTSPEVTQENQAVIQNTINATQTGEGAGYQTNPEGKKLTDMEMWQNAPNANPWYGTRRWDANFAMMRNMAAKMAGAKKQAAEEGFAVGGPSPEALEGFANKANAFSSAAEYAQLGREGIEKIGGRIANFGSSLPTSGRVLGFSPQASDLGIAGASHILGIPNPVAAFASPAGQQGLGAETTALNASLLGTGLGIGQAKEATHAIQEMGFRNSGGGIFGSTEGDGSEIFNAITPYLKEGGTPQAYLPFYEAIKTGSVSIDQVTKSLKNMKNVAHDTYQTLEQTSAGLQGYTQAAVARGASSPQAASAGLQYSALSGVPTQYAQHTIESPMGQMFAFSKFGAIPETAGLLSGSQLLSTQMAEIQAYKGMSGPIPTVKGHTRQESQAAWIASQTDMPRNYVEHLIENKHSILKSQKLIENIDPNSSGTSKAIEGMKEKNFERGLHKEIQNLKHQSVPKHYATGGKGAPAGASALVNPHKEAEELEEESGPAFNRYRAEHPQELTAYQKKIIGKGGEINGHMVASVQEQGKWAHEAGMSSSQQSAFEHEYEKSPTKAREKLQKYLEKKGDIKPKGSGNKENRVEITMSPQTARHFNLNIGGSRAGEGGSSSASYAGSPSVEVESSTG